MLMLLGEHEAIAKEDCYMLRCDNNQFTLVYRTVEIGIVFILHIICYPTKYFNVEVREYRVFGFSHSVVAFKALEEKWHKSDSSGIPTASQASHKSIECEEFQSYDACVNRVLTPK